MEDNGKEEYLGIGTMGPLRQRKLQRWNESLTSWYSNYFFLSSSLSQVGFITIISWNWLSFGLMFSQLQTFKERTFWSCSCIIWPPLGSLPSSTSTTWFEWEFWSCIYMTSCWRQPSWPIMPSIIMTCDTIFCDLQCYFCGDASRNLCILDSEHNLLWQLGDDRAFSWSYRFCMSFGPT